MATEANWWEAVGGRHVKLRLFVVMGPCVRRDDGGCIAPLMIETTSYTASRAAGWRDRRGRWRCRDRRARRPARGRLLRRRPARAAPARAGWRVGPKESAG